LLNFKSKKAVTLVEMIVSIAIIALVSIALLGIIVPAVNEQSLAKQRNESIYFAAEEIEKKVYGMGEESTDLSDASFITSEDHTLTFEIDGDVYDCGGTMLQSTEQESGVTLHAFVPEEQ
jgi:type II secretory pathway pseudopilin PulG